jgi:hypothetical protein
MNKLFVIAVALLYSCSTPKIIDFDKDYTQKLAGQVKSITAKNYEYKFVKKDTLLLAKTTVLLFDSNNNMISEKISVDDELNESVFIYENNLLVEKKAVGDQNNFRTTYKYDKANNQIEVKSFNDNQNFSTRTREYDQFNNPTKEQYATFGSNFVKAETAYDYKKRYFITKKTNDTLQLLALTSRKNFNSKGYIVKNQSNNPNYKSRYTTYEIDKKGNLTKKTNYNPDDTVIETVTYKNTYDKKGNINIRERFLNGKIIEKTLFDIVYVEK